MRSKSHSFDARLATDGSREAKKTSEMPFWLLARAQRQDLPQALAMWSREQHLGERYHENQGDKGCDEQHSRVQQPRFHGSPHVRPADISALNLTPR